MLVLFADDDADDRELFCEALKEIDEAIRCLMFPDGAQLLAYLKDPANDLPDYVFLDLRMPKLTGKQCLLAIRADSRFKDLPVIIFTTSNEVENSEDLTESGATHFVTKPTNPEEIYYLISMVLTEKWM